MLLQAKIKVIDNNNRREGYDLIGLTVYLVKETQLIWVEFGGRNIKCVTWSGIYKI